ncbi:hypothetical protein FVE85_3777 [Porphyridium purpureum]|uniref:Uncharacterized protein n=1 Tax=Porphyridium purpureum TaxID=35688 RepID=A0A5J4YLI1_PORPP|nr:hypothetical protein FVE85_3777 [Porphyridium purpureum]|eukprot:POR1033..scf249_10
MARPRAHLARPSLRSCAPRSPRGSSRGRVARTRTGGRPQAIIRQARTAKRAQGCARAGRRHDYTLGAGASTASSAAAAARAARALERRQGQVAFSVPIEQLGINKEEFIGERFIKSKKLLKYSEAEEEILHLEDMEMDSTWMRSARLTGLAVFVAGGMTVMGGTGKIWDTFAASQEEKEREEELRITGRFIDTTANRMDEDEKLKKKAEQRKRLEEQFSSIESDDAGESPKEKKSGPSEPPGASPSGGVDFSALDRLLGDDDE